MEYTLKFSRQARKDLKKVERNFLKETVIAILSVLKRNPWQNPPPYEQLSGNLEGYFSRRINIQHRLVYQIFEEAKRVKIIRMWSHYE